MRGNQTRYSPTAKNEICPLAVKVCVAAECMNLRLPDPGGSFWTQFDRDPHCDPSHPKPASNTYFCWFCYYCFLTPRFVWHWSYIPWNSAPSVPHRDSIIFHGGSVSSLHRPVDSGDIRLENEFTDFFLFGVGGGVGFITRTTSLQVTSQSNILPLQAFTPRLCCHII